MPDLRIATAVIFAFLVFKPAVAQTLPSCISAASDADGDGYGWENDASCVITNTSLTQPSFTNLETGEPVNLVRAQWDQSAFLNTQIVCTRRQFDGTAYRFSSELLYEFEALSQTAPFNGNVTIFPLSSFDSTPPITQTWTIDNGIYFGPSDLAATPWVEIIEIESTGFIDPNTTQTRNAVRVWLTNNIWSQCSTLLPIADFAPSFTPDNPVDNCDYSDAARFDGWGWDPIAGQSCAPINTVTSDNCDYTDATQFDGWGWDPISGQSCEPLLDSGSECVDSDGDGWGWDGTQSCQL